MAHSLTTIGVHLECAIQAEMALELDLALIERKQSRRFRHKSEIGVVKTLSLFKSEIKKYYFGMCLSDNDRE